MLPFLAVAALLFSAVARGADQVPAPSAGAQEEATAAPVDQGSGALDQRMTLEHQSETNRFVITPHKPNYILPFTYNSRQNDALGTLDNTEFKFQLSFKVPLSEHIIGRYGKLDFAYTQISFWQTYNREISSPFRETNYEPELMLSFVDDTKLFGFTSRLITFGLVHQSNGQTVPASRSWNRFYASFTLERKNLYLVFRPWYRFRESPKSAPLDTKGDDNPDIGDYLGHGELTIMHLHGRRSLAIMLRNNFRSQHRGALQIDWSVPLQGKLRGYVQYFNGYGESLIDYNHSGNRIGIGVMLSDWL
jgi:phospholipase A1